jgi:hypothetical protein
MLRNKVGIKKMMKYMITDGELYVFISPVR